MLMREEKGVFFRRLNNTTITTCLAQIYLESLYIFMLRRDIPAGVQGSMPDTEVC